MSKFIVVRTSNHEVNKFVPVLDNYKPVWNGAEGTVREFASADEAVAAAGNMALNDQRGRTWMALEVLVTFAAAPLGDQTVSNPVIVTGATYPDENDGSE